MIWLVHWYNCKGPHGAHEDDEEFSLLLLTGEEMGGASSLVVLKETRLSSSSCNRDALWLSSDTCVFKDAIVSSYSWNDMEMIHWTPHTIVVLFSKDSLLK